MLAATLVALLCAAAAHGRQLSDSAVFDEQPCNTRWSATLDVLLSNTLLSSREGLGKVLMSLNSSEQKLVYKAFLKDDADISSIRLQVRTADAVNVVSLPLLADKKASGLLHRVDAGGANYDAISIALQNGHVVVAVEAKSVKTPSLIGVLTSSCTFESKKEDMIWKLEASLPSCDIPAFSELYEIPKNCPDFLGRVRSSCNVLPEDVLTASSHDAEGNPLVAGIAAAACLPKGCDPCSTSRPWIPKPAIGLKQLTAGAQKGQESVYFTQSFACQQPGFESLYAVPQLCDNLADRLVDICEVSVEEVLQASFKAAELREGICLPKGCDPCTLNPKRTQDKGLDDGAPFCRHTFLFTKPYTITESCGYFPEKLEYSCGVNPEAVAMASGMESYPAYAGFGIGKTVCLPETCDPCAAEKVQLQRPLMPVSVF